MNGVLRILISLTVTLSTCCWTVGTKYHRHHHHHRPSAILASGSSSAQSSTGLPMFEWRFEDFSECSVTCGDGEEISEATCRNSKTGQRVQEIHCDQKEKRQRLVRRCRLGNCHAVWIEGEWGPCSAVCGGGLSMRNIYCAEEVDPGIFQRTLDRLCLGQKPEMEKKCNINHCPQWKTSQWSKCSKSCGTGIQERSVVCRRTKTLNCLDEMKPMAKRVCHQRPCDQTRPGKKSGNGSRDFRKESASGLDKRISGNDYGDLTREYNYRHKNRRHQTGNGIPVEGPHEPTPIPLPETTSHGTDADLEDKDKVPVIQTPTALTEEDFSSGEETEDLEGREENAIHLAEMLREKELELERYSVVQLEPINELTLVAPNRSLEVALIPGTNLRVFCRSDVGHASSVWTRNGQGISKNELFIVDVRQEHAGIYSCLRGRHLLRLTVKVLPVAEIRLMRLARADAIESFRKVKSQRDLDSRTSSVSVRLLSNGIVIPDLRMLDSGMLSYIAASDWSECHCAAAAAEAAVAAVQTRAVSCELVTEFLAVEVDAMYCRRQKANAVESRRNCTRECYYWAVGPWNQCSDLPCMSPGFGTRWRLVQCNLDFNASAIMVDDRMCNSIGRPTTYGSCPLDVCQPKWITKPWSQCSVSCGRKGVKTREVKCVWPIQQTTTDERFCDELQRPTNRKLCIDPPCINDYCRDESIYCSTVPVFGLCTKRSYYAKCCYSCMTYRPYRPYQQYHYKIN